MKKIILLVLATLGCLPAWSQTCTPAPNLACTTNLNLFMPASSYTGWGPLLNDNWQKLDALWGNFPILNAPTNTFTGIVVANGFTGPLTGHATSDLPLTGGVLSGPLVAPQTNLSYTPAPGSTLQATITAAGANSDTWLGCGTYTVAAGLTISSPNLHLYAASRDCTFINFTSSTGLTVSAPGVEIMGITFEGATLHSVTATSAATGFRFHDNAITQGGAVAGSLPAGLWLQAGITDAVVERNKFTGNGPATIVSGNATGYTILSSGQGSGLSANIRIRNNELKGNNNAIGIACFDCSPYTQIKDNKCDQGNVYDGGEGSGYCYMLYEEGFSISTSSLSRTANFVTAVVATQLAGEPWTIGQTVFPAGYGFGINGTSFSGIFTLTGASGTGPYTLTWAQTAPDDTVTGGALNGALGNVLQHSIVSGNIATNCAGACFYFQGVSDAVVASNEASQCDLTIVPVSLLHACYSFNGMWRGSITGNSADFSGHSSAYYLAHTYGVAFDGNVGVNAAKDGLRVGDTYDLAAAGNTFANNLNGGVVGESVAAINCFHCGFADNVIYTSAGTDGYHFAGLDQHDNVTGGVIHGPSTGTANAGVFVLSPASDISVTSLQVNCYADGSTTKATNYGLRSQGTRVTFKSNPKIIGCAIDGILEAGTNDDVEQNTITASATGVVASASTGLTLKDNNLAGNTTAKTTAGATSLIDSGNITALGTFPAYQVASVTYPDGSSTSTATTTASVYQWGSNTNTLEEHDLNAAAGHQRIFGMQTAGVARWALTADSTAETGSNTGTPFCLYAFSDAGTTIDTPICIVRAAGGAETHTRPITAPTLTLNGAGCGAGTYAKADGSGCGPGGGGGGGSVSSFAAPSGSWPAWLVPTVTNPTTTPSLAVAASAIPNSALAHPLPTATDTKDTVQVDASGNGTILTPATSGTWEAVQNGGADNTGAVDASTILNAETTAICSSTTPVRIHLAAGTYTVNSGWTIAATSTTCKNVVIEGDGSGNTVLQSTCAGANKYVLDYVNSTSPAAEHFNGPTIRHLMVKNNGGATCNAGLIISQAALFKVEDVVITGFAGQTYSTGTISSTGSTVNCAGCTWTAAMVHGFIETTSTNTTTRSEVCAFVSSTQITLCDSAFPTGNIAALTAYALPYGGDGFVCDPGAGIASGPFTQYATLKDVYASGNLVGIHAWGTTSGGCSRIQVSGNAGYISPNPGSRVTDAVGIFLAHNSDTWEISGPLNNAAACIVNDSGHTNWINGAKCENGGSFAPVTTCNGGVGIQACTAAWEVSADANGSGWNTTFTAPYAYKVGNVFQFDNATGAFNSSIVAPRDLSGQYTLHYSFYGTTGCPGNASGIPVIVSAYDCNHQLVAQTVN